ncbi:unnamed protein product [Amoebophrya sp. A25]|nr:unnamed protein product [Amoebophrya sp. A25]|eukprot:GSA25T00015793001.1
MGVHGLWDLLAPAGTTCDLKGLRNQTVAVDASIWMFHFVKAMRDPDGNMVEGAHLLGFFRRIVKLLHLGIRPIFVFDGPPPEVKRRTLRQRQLQREQGGLNLQKVTERLFRNLLRKEVAKMEGMPESADGDADGDGEEQEGGCWIEDLTEVDGGASSSSTSAQNQGTARQNRGNRGAAKGKAPALPAATTTPLVQPKLNFLKKKKDAAAAAAARIEAKAEATPGDASSGSEESYEDQEDDLLADSPVARRKRRKKKTCDLTKNGPTTTTSTAKAPPRKGPLTAAAASSRSNQRTENSAAADLTAHEMEMNLMVEEMLDNQDPNLESVLEDGAAFLQEPEDEEPREEEDEDGEEEDDNDEMEIEILGRASSSAAANKKSASSKRRSDGKKVLDANGNVIDDGWERRKRQRGYGLGVSVGQSALDRDIQVSDEVLKRYLLKMPENITRSDETKGYEIEGPDGVKRLVTLPLGTLVDPEVFDRLDPMKRYETLTNLIDAWLTETRVKAMECRTSREAFSNVQLETFYRHIRTNKLLEETKLELAKVRKENGGELLGDELSGLSGSANGTGSSSSVVAGLTLNPDAPGGVGAEGLDDAASGNLANWLKLRPIAAGFASTLRGGGGKKGKKGKKREDGKGGGGGGRRFFWRDGGRDGAGKGEESASNKVKSTYIKGGAGSVAGGQVDASVDANAEGGKKGKGKKGKVPYDPFPEMEDDGAPSAFDDAASAAGSVATSVGGRRRGAKQPQSAKSHFTDEHGMSFESLDVSKLLRLGSGSANSLSRMSTTAASTFSFSGVEQTTTSSLTRTRSITANFFTKTGGSADIQFEPDHDQASLGGGDTLTHRTAAASSSTSSSRPAGGPSGSGRNSASKRRRLSSPGRDWNSLLFGGGNDDFEEEDYEDIRSEEEKGSKNEVSVGQLQATGRVSSISPQRTRENFGTKRHHGPQCGLLCVEENGDHDDFDPLADMEADMENFAQENERGNHVHALLAEEAKVQLQGPSETQTGIQELRTCATSTGTQDAVTVAVLVDDDMAAMFDMDFDDVDGGNCVEPACSRDAVEDTKDATTKNATANEIHVATRKVLGGEDANAEMTANNSFHFAQEGQPEHLSLDDFTLETNHFTANDAEELTLDDFSFEEVENGEDDQSSAANDLQGSAAPPSANNRPSSAAISNPALILIPTGNAVPQPSPALPTPSTTTPSFTPAVFSQASVGEVTASAPVSPTTLPAAVARSTTSNVAATSPAVNVLGPPAPSSSGGPTPSAASSAMPPPAIPTKKANKTDSQFSYTAPKTSQFVTADSSEFASLKVFDPNAFSFGSSSSSSGGTAGAVGVQNTAQTSAARAPGGFGFGFGFGGASVPVPKAGFGFGGGFGFGNADGAGGGFGFGTTTVNSAGAGTGLGPHNVAGGGFLNKTGAPVMLESAKELDTLENAVDAVFGPSQTGIATDTLISDLRAEMHKAKRDEEFISQDMYEELKKLLYAFGVPYVEAPSEAEAQCAYLVEAKLANCVISDDSDVVVFSAKSGTTKVFRHLFSSKGEAEKYTSRNISQLLGLAYDDMIALAMLLGCDYTMGVKGIGIVNALEIIEAFGKKRDIAMPASEIEISSGGVSVGPSPSSENSGYVDRASCDLNNAPTAVEPPFAAAVGEEGALDEEQNHQPSTTTSGMPFNWLTELKNLREWAQDVANFDNKEFFEPTKVTKKFHIKHRALRPYWVFPVDFPSREVWDAFQKPIVDHSREKFEWGTVDLEAIVRLLGRYMTDALVERTLDMPRIEEMRKERAQADYFGQFFQLEEEQPIALVRSVRLRRAIAKMRGAAEESESEDETGSDDDDAADEDDNEHEGSTVSQGDGDRGEGERNAPDRRKTKKKRKKKKANAGVLGDEEVPLEGRAKKKKKKNRNVEGEDQEGQKSDLFTLLEQGGSSSSSRPAAKARQRVKAKAKTRIKGKAKPKAAGAARGAEEAVIDVEQESEGGPQEVEGNHQSSAALSTHLETLGSESDLTNDVEMLGAAPRPTNRSGIGRVEVGESKCIPFIPGSRNAQPSSATSSTSLQIDFMANKAALPSLATPLCKTSVQEVPEVQASVLVSAAFRAPPASENEGATPASVRLEGSVEGEVNVAITRPAGVATDRVLGQTRNIQPRASSSSASVHAAPAAATIALEPSGRVPPNATAKAKAKARGKAKAKSATGRANALPGEEELQLPVPVFHPRKKNKK